MTYRLSGCRIFADGEEIGGLTDIALPPLLGIDLASGADRVGAVSRMGGVRIIEDATLVCRVEDWSRVRSPSRAARRRRQGHPQNIRTVEAPSADAITMDGGRSFIMHPETARRLYAMIDEAAP
jgi:hypothetical protein